MNIARRLSLAVLLANLVLAAIAADAAGSRSSKQALVVGLDHIPVVVGDLDQAAETYRQLGFTLKPGRPHENGIRNRHVKFPDGTEIELITADAARDALTSSYRKHIGQGDGPVYAGFFAPDFTQLSGRLDALGYTFDRAGGLLTFPPGNSLQYLFFGHRNATPSDRPEHFQHENGAQSLIGIWLAGSGLAELKNLLTGLGAGIAEEYRHAPEPLQTPVARFPQAEIIFLPQAYQLMPGRIVAGATLGTKDLAALQAQLAAQKLPVPPVTRTAGGLSMFLPPDLTHGIWLEFRQLP